LQYVVFHGGVVLNVMLSPGGEAAMEAIRTTHALYFAMLPDRRQIRGRHHHHVADRERGGGVDMERPAPASGQRGRHRRLRGRIGIEERDLIRPGAAVGHRDRLVDQAVVVDEALRHREPGLLGVELDRGARRGEHLLDAGDLLLAAIRDRHPREDREDHADQQRAHDQRDHQLDQREAALAALHSASSRVRTTSSGSM
jgi:hypothetical protein